jgi:hypothetical protein
MTTINLSNSAFGELDTIIYSVMSTQINGGTRIPPDAPTGAWKLNVTTADGGKASSVFMINKVPVPAVISITPATMYRNTTVAFTLQGTSFQTDGRTVVNLTNVSGYNITTTLSAVYPTLITGNVSLPDDNITGIWKVNVTTIDGGMGTKVNAVTIL